MLTSVESEAAVLGAMMLDRAVVPIAENILRDEMYFSNLEYRMIYRLLLDINKRNNSGWDIVCFRDELKKRNQLNAVGGVEALVEIANTTPSSANCLYYSNIVLDKYKRRRLCEYADNLKLTVGQG
jgi:replicative DNA helicase